MTAVTGVSGSGKSTLVATSCIGAEALVTGYAARGRIAHPATAHRSRRRVDQSPIGRRHDRSRLYVGVYDEIRKLFARVPEARARGYAPAFLLQRPGGPCERCAGRKGPHRDVVPSDVWVVCDDWPAGGSDRRRRGALQGRSIAEVSRYRRRGRRFFEPCRHPPVPLPHGRSRAGVRRDRQASNTLSGAGAAHQALRGARQGVRARRSTSSTSRRRPSHVGCRAPDVRASPARRPGTRCSDRAQSRGHRGVPIR